MAKIAKLRRGGDRRSDQSADLRNGPTAAEAAAQLNVSTRIGPAPAKIGRRFRAKLARMLKKAAEAPGGTV